MCMCVLYVNLHKVSTIIDGVSSTFRKFAFLWPDWLDSSACNPSQKAALQSVFSTEHLAPVYPRHVPQQNLPLDRTEAWNLRPEQSVAGWPGWLRPPRLTTAAESAGTNDAKQRALPLLFSVEPIFHSLPSDALDAPVSPFLPLPHSPCFPQKWKKQLEKRVQQDSRIDSSIHGTHKVRSTGGTAGSETIWSKFPMKWYWKSTMAPGMNSHEFNGGSIGLKYLSNKNTTRHASKGCQHEFWFKQFPT